MFQPGLNFFAFLCHLGLQNTQGINALNQQLSSDIDTFCSEHDETRSDVLFFLMKDPHGDAGGLSREYVLRIPSVS